MAQLMLVNPRRRRTTKRRRNPESRAQRSRAAKKGWAHRRSTTRRRRRNPWPGDHAGHVRAARKGWRRRRRNPIRGGIVKDMIMPSAVMAAGGVGLDALWGLLPIPTAISGNAGINALAKGAGAIGLGMALEAMGQKKTGELVAMGGLTVALYDAMRQAVTTFAPNLTLGYTGAGMDAGSMGLYLPAQEAAPAPSGGPSVTGMGEYLPSNASAT